MPLARLFKVIVRIRGNLEVVFPRKYEMVPLGAGLEPLFVIDLRVSRFMGPRRGVLELR